MRKSVVIAVVVATLTGLAGGSIAVAPVVQAHPTTHQISIANKAAPEGTAAQQSPTSGTMTVSVSPAPLLGETIVVPWFTGTTGTGPGHATAGPAPTHPTDFEDTDGQVVFTAGETSEDITIRITADHANEPDETFQVNLDSEVCTECTIIDGEGIYTIQNDDAAETLSINDVSMNEGRRGTVTVFEFSVTRSPGSTKAVTVQFATADGTATAAGDPINAPPDDDDYESQSGTLNFPAGHAARTEPIRVIVNGDSAVEGNETFFVNLFNQTPGVTLSDGQGLGTIQNDDSGDPAMTISDASATEGGNLTFTVSLDEAPGVGQQAQVQYSTNDGPPGPNGATSTGDYVDHPDPNTTLTFTTGQTTKQITVATIEDAVEEQTETMSVVLTKPTVCCTGDYDYEIVDDTGIGTIHDDDKPTLSINDVTVTEGDIGDTTIATFTVTKTGSSTFGNTTVDFATRSDLGTATANADYQPTSGTLTFNHSQPVQTQTIDVNVLGDIADEPNETFIVELTGAVNGTITDPQGVGTITDDDVTPAGHDFNGDGFDDAVFGAPREDLGSKKNAGSVNVIYGSASRLQAGPSPQDQLWSLDSSNVQGTAVANDQYGAAVAVGDFNGDQRADLAVGVPRASGGSGAVSVLYGSASGLTATSNQLWTQGSPDVVGDPNAGDRFGTALTAADFNGDTRTDLAIGVPGETVGGDGAAGAVNVLYGSASGLTATNNQLWDQDNDGAAGDSENAEPGDAFGRSLASGDVSGDGFADLVVGAPNEDVAASNDGAATVLLGSGSGLSAAGSKYWHQNVDGVEDQAEAGDGFASSLAVGDFNGDGPHDLAAGVPFEDVGDADAGGVNVLFGSLSTGLVASSNQFWTQDSPGLADSTQAGDRFGSALAAADFDNDDRDDLGIGVPREDYSSKVDAGVVSVLYGSVAGLTTSDDQRWHADKAGIKGKGESNDLFGGALAAGDFNNNGSFDLVVGAYGEDLGSSKNAGSAHVLYGSAPGLTAGGDQLWHQDVSGVKGRAETGDAFAQALG